MKGPRHHVNRWRGEWTRVTTILALLAALLGWSGWTTRADLALYDSALAWWPQPSPNDIIIVAIDEPSLQTIGRWPWRRALHATALARIAEGHPKAILLDVLFSEPDPDPAQDAVLAEALARVGRVVLPVGMASGAAGDIRELRPISVLSKHATLAHADAALDVDGVMRWAYLKAGEGQPHLPHMAPALLRLAGEPTHLSIAAQTAPLRATRDDSGQSSSWRREDRVAIHYLGPPGTISTVSYSDVMSGRIPASRFENRFVLIGATAQGMGNSFQTPVSRQAQPMASVEITAHLLDMLRTGQQIRWASPLAIGLGAASLVMVLMAGYWSLSPRRALLITAISMVAVPVLCMLGLRAGLWFGPSSYVVVAALSYPLWSWRRLETTSVFLAEELHRLRATPGVLSSVSPATPTGDDQDYLERQISSVRQATQQLQDARRLVDDTLNGLPCAVVVVDREGAVQRVNEQLVRLVRAAAQVPVVGQDAARLLAPWTPNDAPHWSLLMERALQGATPVSSEVQGPGGDQHLVGLVPLVDDHGVAQGLIICLTDITSLRRAEQHRAELLGFIAHDIRSPQASLVSLVQLQRMNPSSMSYEEVLAHVDTLAHSTLTLCEELLQIMRSESRPLRREAMDLVTIIDQARGEAQPQALARHITLIWTWPEGQHAELMGDASQLKRALMNLLSNAIKFSPEHTSVTITLASRPGQWVLSVSDQGPGITQADVSRLFKRYERIESDEPLRLAPGIGLGLVFVDTVIKRHGGQIRVISAPGQGATFEWTLPAE